MRYQVLKDAVRKALDNRKKMLDVIEKTLHESLKSKQFVLLTITDRKKHLYSIYDKIHTKYIPFNEIIDVYAFRIIVWTIFDSRYCAWDFMDYLTCLRAL